MTLMVLFQYFQVFLSLIIGLLIVRKFQKSIGNLVIQLIPVKKRVTDDFLNLKTKYTYIISLLIFVVISFTGYLLLETIERKTSPSSQQKPKSRKQETLVPSSTTQSIPFNLAPKVKSEASTPSESTLTPTTYETSVPSPSPKPKPAKPQKAIANQKLYLQLHAFKLEQNAYTTFESYYSNYGSLVQLGYDPNSTIPYKLLLGPFLNRSDIQQFKLQQSLQGFVRDLQGIRIL
ncbi:MAG: hypothetical protein AAFO07_00055 [Bacteroidota bacterium]